MGRTCIRGPRYPDEMEAKITFAEHLRNGRKVSGYYLCNKCGGYHIGVKQEKQEKCWATAKFIYRSYEAAEQRIKTLKAKGRGESRHYKCQYCNQLHLTSLTSRETR